jgi:hypothetical protein
MRLELERSNDPSGSLRLILFATCWVYNYSDVVMLVRSTKTYAERREDHNVEVLPPNFCPDLRAEHTLLPALVHLEPAFKAAALLGEGEWFRAAGLENAPRGQAGQRQLTHKVPERMLLEHATMSGWTLHLKLTGGTLDTHAFVFKALNQTVSARRAVCVEIRRAGRPPFNRSVQLIFRTRYIMVNALPDVRRAPAAVLTPARAGGPVR